MFPFDFPWCSPAASSFFWVPTYFCSELGYRFPSLPTHPPNSPWTILIPRKDRGGGRQNPSRRLVYQVLSLLPITTRGRCSPWPPAVQAPPPPTPPARQGVLLRHCTGLYPNFCLDGGSASTTSFIFISPFSGTVC